MHGRPSKDSTEVDTTDLSTHTIESLYEFRSTLIALGLVEELPPLRIGERRRYELLRLLGRGAMGTVYLAEDIELNRREVAVKVVTSSSAQYGELERRLRREAWALALLDHPNVLHVYDIGTTLAGQLFIVMQYVAGPTLRQWVTKARRSLSELLTVFCAAGRGLQAAHDKGLIHRDFKPDNVLLRGAERQPLAVVGDFGLAGGPSLSDDGRGPLVSAATRAYSSHALLGTPAYMAPEQRRRTTLGPPSDQYAFCVSLWEMSIGELPQFTDGRLVLSPRARELPGWLLRTLSRGLADDPEQRFPDMQSLVGVLEGTARRQESARLLDLLRRARNLQNLGALQEATAELQLALEMVELMDIPDHTLDSTPRGGQLRVCRVDADLEMPGDLAHAHPSQPQQQQVSALGIELGEGLLE